MPCPLVKHPGVELRQTSTCAAWSGLLGSWGHVLATRLGREETIDELVRAIEAHVVDRAAELRALSWTAR